MRVWKSDLQAATSRGVSHLSSYGLTYEKGAHYWSQLQKGQIVAVAEEVELEMYLYAIETLTSARHESLRSFEFCQTRK